MWYRHVSTRAPDSLQADMAKVTGDYGVLYCREQPHPPRTPIPTYVKPFRLNDNTTLHGRWSQWCNVSDSIRLERTPISAWRILRNIYWRHTWMGEFQPPPQAEDVEESS